MQVPPGSGGSPADPAGGSGPVRGLEPAARRAPSAGPPEVTLAVQPGITQTRTGASAAPRTSTPVRTVAPPEKMSAFDYFVLALSWSPDYCATDGINDPQECSLGKKLGFVLHGLWPQNNQGYPSSCTNEALPASVKAAFPQLYPNDSLFDHEWEKHGTCTGLSPQELPGAVPTNQAVGSHPGGVSRPGCADPHHCRTTDPGFRPGQSGLWRAVL